MIPQNQIHISQVLNSLDNPNTNPTLLNNYLINIFAQNIIFNNQLEVNRLNELFNIIHLNVQHKYLTFQQRRMILERLSMQKFPNIGVFENVLGGYLK